MTGDKDEPGAAKFGNFIDYYKFNPSDKRLEVLTDEFWKLLRVDDNAVCLDIGCNTGDLTCALYQKLSVSNKHIKFIGIDLDEILIQRATENSSDASDVSFLHMDVCDVNFTDEINKVLQLNNFSKFHCIFMFSVTMWIHLNCGDEGLNNVLAKVSELCDYLVVEAQPWKCYKTAIRRMRKYKKSHFPLWESLTIRETVEEDINSYLVSDCKMSLIYTSQLSHWHRRVKLYKNNQIT